MTTIDLNCDMGEGCGNDAELMDFVSSVNIACGFHAGNDETMRTTARLAFEKGVAIGAHPSFPDRENFGRKEMTFSFEEIHDLVIDQILKLMRVCEILGTRLHHVKPHGALYNQAAKDREVAAAIVEGVSAIDNKLAYYGLSGSMMIEEAERVGLRAVSEVFADRTYQSDGTLTPRSIPNALITDENTSLTQVLDMVNYGRVRSIDAIMVPIKAETICIHGDGENAVEFARGIKQALTARAIRIAAVA
jgi:UPF0271 protein